MIPDKVLCPDCKSELARDPEQDRPSVCIEGGMILIYPCKKCEHSVTVYLSPDGHPEPQVKVNDGTRLGRKLPYNRVRVSRKSSGGSILF